jgi:UDP-glucuronate decarboxylase
MTSFRKKKILVTGGAGFLGSHLCQQLLQQGHVVVCVDNFFTGSRDNLFPFIDHSSFQFIEQDICQGVGADADVDGIYNLACPASPIHYQHDPVKTIKTNVYGALNVLELAKIRNARVLQASTSEVYGDPHVHPQGEEYWGNVNPIGIRSCYDEGKRCAETLFFDFFRQFGISIKVARIFNTYGPRMHPNDGRVVSNFIVQALKNEPVTIYGSGSQTRSFCYVDDLIQGLILLMDSEASLTGPINLGNPVEFTICDLANLVLELTGSRSQLVFQPLPGDDPKQRKPDITLAKEKLGWEPKIQLREGLAATIAYFDKLL